MSGKEENSQEPEKDVRAEETKSSDDKKNSSSSETKSSYARKTENDKTSDKSQDKASDSTKEDLLAEKIKVNSSSGKLPRPPIQTLIFWVSILVVLPLIIFMFSPKKRSAGIDNQLDVKRFEQLLEAGLVQGTQVEKLPETGRYLLKGVYLKDPAGSITDPNNNVHFSLEILPDTLFLRNVKDKCKGKYRVITKTNPWSSILGFLPIVLMLVVIYFIFSRQFKSAGKGAMMFGKSRARLMTPTKDKVTFADIGGVDEAKEDMIEIVDFLKDPDRFNKLGGKIPRGVLLVGSPGTGKTLLAKAIAGEADVPFFSISGSDFVEMFVGVGASRVRDMFSEGKRQAPCLLFIDEIDAVGRTRGTGLGGGHDEREQTLNALLVEMDGFESNNGVIVIAATNRPDVLDPALLRPGRFDRQISVDLPDNKGRLEILQLHTRKVKISEFVELKIIARGTPGFSGADLANLINESALIAARLDKKEIDMTDLEEARDKVRWGKERRSRTINEKERRLTAFHEAGHALAGMLCEHATPLHKITIIPRGMAYLGATMHLPATDRYTQGRKEMHDELVVLMGGRVAEMLTQDDITSGASADIQQATAIAKRMVTQWGMSELIGPISYSGREEHIYLGRDIVRSEDYSEKTAQVIDSEVRKLVQNGYDRAVQLLKDNSAKLTLLSETLLEKETMNAKEVYELLEMEPQGDKAIGIYERAVTEAEHLAKAEEKQAKVEDSSEEKQDKSEDNSDA